MDKGDWEVYPHKKRVIEIILLLDEEGDNTGKRNF